MRDGSDRSKALHQRRWRRLLEASAIFLLSAASVATSWSSYQAARWGGVQSTLYSEANALRLESTRASAKADQLHAIDVELFAAWIEAYARREPVLQEFYEQRLRDEFLPAFRIWLATEPGRNRDAPKTPFQLPAYRLSERDEAEQLAMQAEATFARGQDANELSDAYVLNAVLFATVLFFAGIAQQFRVLPVQGALLALASVVLAIGGWNVMTLPRQ